MPTSSRFSVGFLVCFIVGMLITGAGLLTAVNIKGTDDFCNQAQDARKIDGPTSNETALCIARQEDMARAKADSQSTAAIGLVLLGVAVMVSGVGFAVMRSNVAQRTPASAPYPIPR
ncbi:hypothetical protein [Actinoallomurus sp. NPDC050550]|uniref:hypothetical protein n=1 Tax=Actinoallomurus sp. NPDC050550 TaxID=3154937 RepID=UPI0033C9317F